MAAGKPILVAGDGAASDLVKKVGCGMAVPSGDFVGWAAEIQKMSLRSAQEKADLGNKGREYAKQTFDRGNYYVRLVRELRSLAKK
jgi:colanic acid biosynthesis glycosyl transferase WcaI